MDFDDEAFVELSADGVAEFAPTVACDRLFDILPSFHDADTVQQLMVQRLSVCDEQLATFHQQSCEFDEHSHERAVHVGAFRQVDDDATNFWHGDQMANPLVKAFREIPNSIPLDFHHGDGAFFRDVKMTLLPRLFTTLPLTRIRMKSPSFSVPTIGFAVFTTNVMVVES